MSDPAPTFPGQPDLWYPLVRPCKGIQRVVVCRSAETNLAAKIQQHFADLPVGYSMAVLHRRSQLPMPVGAWNETFLILPAGGGSKALLSNESYSAFRVGIPLLPGGRFRTRLLRACLYLPGMHRLVAWKQKERLTLISKPISGDDRADMQTHQTPVAVVEGVPGPLQKLVVRHIENGHEHIYKLAGTILARRAVQHEIGALSSLAGSTLGPRLVGRDYDQDPRWFAQEALRGKRPKPTFNVGVLTWLASLAAREQNSLAPEAVQPSLYDGRNWDLAGPEFEALANVLRTYQGERLIPCTQSHGDFTPWNARLSGGQLQAFDWEFFSPSRPALFDYFHFMLQSAVLLQRDSMEQALGNTFFQLRNDGQSLLRVCGVEDEDIEVLAAHYLLLVVERDSILNKIETPEFDQVNWLARARCHWARQLASLLEQRMNLHRRAA